MIPGPDFKLLMSAERKLAKGETLTAEEQRVVNTYGVTSPKICGRKGCTNKLEPRVDGERHKIDNVEVCEDCYFDSMGDELEKYPITLGLRGARGCGHID